MSQLPELRYHRARFSTRLPIDRVYTASHFWLWEVEPDLWRVGLTRFATRMLGELVEFTFEVQPGDPVALGQEIGSLEGFKAISDLISVFDGTFRGANTALEGDITLLDTDPYGEGWLYLAEGQPDESRVDAEGYVAILDATIDKMLEGMPEGASG